MLFLNQLIKDLKTIKRHQILHTIKNPVKQISLDFFN